MQGGYPSQPSSPVPPSPSEVPASCPPSWLMFSSPQESRLASRHSSDFWEPNPRPRSHSLNPAHLRSRVKFAISDSEEEGEGHSEEEERPSSENGSSGEGSGSGSIRPDQRQGGSPNLLDLPASQSGLGPQQRRRNLRQSSLSGLETSCFNSKLPSSSSHRPPNSRAHTLDRIPTITHHKPTYPVSQ